MKRKEWARRGLEGVPLKLLLVALLISTSLPIVASNMDDFQTAVGAAGVGAEASRLASSISEVHAAGEGNVRIVTVELPRGQDTWIEIGGDGIDAMSVRGFSAGKAVDPVYLEDPPVRVIADGGSMVIGDGTSTVRLECIQADGRLVVRAGASA